MHLSNLTACRVANRSLEISEMVAEFYSTNHSRKMERTRCRGRHSHTRTVVHVYTYIVIVQTHCGPFAFSEKFSQQKKRFERFNYRSFVSTWAHIIPYMWVDSFASSQTPLISSSESSFHIFMKMTNNSSWLRRLRWQWTCFGYTETYKMWMANFLHSPNTYLLAVFQLFYVNRVRFWLFSFE